MHPRHGRLPASGLFYVPYLAAPLRLKVVAGYADAPDMRRNGSTPDPTSDPTWDDLDADAKVDLLAELLAHSHERLLKLEEVASVAKVLAITASGFAVVYVVLRLCQFFGVL